ncbi:Endonuclease/exonuclease/phosphatase [Gorgonomyces haynaldii]|nr:Endonuclease/exonuclease/phosphatase [Gorgonomyces haynaldii]
MVSLSLVTFNIRTGDANDGINRWSARKSIAGDFLKQHPPSLMGMQEANDYQARDVAQMTGLKYVWTGREKNLGGEGVPIFWDSRFNLINSTTFWLSDTPEVQGSRSWGNTLPRICTQAYLDLAGQTISVFNIHLDNASENSRMKSAELVCSRMRPVINSGIPVILFGDFNSDINSQAVRTIAGCQMVDAHKGSNQGTFHAFTGVAQTNKIDYVFISEKWAQGTRDPQILTDHVPAANGKPDLYPSDHFAVSATLDL